MKLYGPFHKFRDSFEIRGRGHVLICLPPVGGFVPDLRMLDSA
jgi:hypothetical protein